VQACEIISRQVDYRRRTSLPTPSRPAPDGGRRRRDIAIPPPQKKTAPPPEENGNPLPRARDNAEVAHPLAGAASASPDREDRPGKASARFVSPAPTSSRTRPDEVPRVHLPGAPRSGRRAFARQGRGSARSRSPSPSPGRPAQLHADWASGLRVRRGCRLGRERRGRAGLGHYPVSTATANPAAHVVRFDHLIRLPSDFPLYSTRHCRSQPPGIPFSAPASTGYSVRAIASAMVLAPGAASWICGILPPSAAAAACSARSRSTGYFSSVTLLRWAGAARPSDPRHRRQLPLLVRGDERGALDRRLRARIEGIAHTLADQVEG